MTDLSLSVQALLTGRAVPFRGAETSAIAKQATGGAVQIGPLGIVGDEQADRVHHGGPDKALHLYAQEHYSYWRDFLGGHERLEAPGAFGENITSLGATEGALCLGDRFRFGTALLEISHGRQPCWKIDHHFGRKGITAQIVRTGRCGVYLRVIEPGMASAGDVMTLLDRPWPDWTVERLFLLLIAGQREGVPPSALAALADMPVLAQAWRDIAWRACKD